MTVFLRLAALSVWILSKHSPTLGTATPPSLVCAAPKNVLPDFDVTKLFGVTRWYEVKRSQSKNTTSETACHTIQIANGEHVGHDAIVEMHMCNLQTTVSLEVQGHLVYQDASARGAMYLISSGETFHVWAVATDYTEFLVVIVCNDAINKTDGPVIEMTFVLSSERTLADSHLNEVQQALQNAGVKGVEDSPQTSCPEIQDEPGCPHPNPIQNFDIEKYSGSWHEVQVTPNLKTAQVCKTHVFSSASYTVAFFEKTYNLSQGVYTTQQGKVLIVDIANPARLLVTTPRSALAEDYWVVDTDYVTYSVVLSCTSVTYSDTIGVRVRVLSRDYRLSRRSKKSVIKALEPLNVLPESMVDLDVDRCVPDTCPKYPPAVANLDMTQFAGPWYEVARLGGDCSCVFYEHTETPNGSVFLQVGLSAPDQPDVRVLEAEPVQVFANDGRYTISSQDTFTRYNILSASYNSWALVSFCEEPYKRGASVKRSWAILSRSPFIFSLPMKEIVDVLHEYDLNYNDFSVDCWKNCASPKCPSSIPVSKNFDWDAFKGVWFVLEEAPSEATTGFCARHIFQEKGTAPDTARFLVVSQWDLRNHTNISRTYSLEQPESDLGKFYATGTANVSDTYTNYWILDTDYSAYAVVQSCSDSAGGRSESLTWLLSRRPEGIGCKASKRTLDAFIHGYVNTRSLRHVEQTPDMCRFMEPPPVGAASSLTVLNLAFFLVTAYLVQDHQPNWVTRQHVV